MRVKKKKTPLCRGESGRLNICLEVQPRASEGFLGVMLVLSTFCFGLLLLLVCGLECAERGSVSRVSSRAWLEFLSPSATSKHLGKLFRDCIGFLFNY